MEKIQRNKFERNEMIIKKEMYKKIRLFLPETKLNHC